MDVLQLYHCHKSSTQAQVAFNNMVALQTTNMWNDTTSTLHTQMKTKQYSNPHISKTVIYKPWIPELYKSAQANKNQFTLLIVEHKSVSHWCSRLLY